MLALTIFVAYVPTSSYEEEEVEAFYMDLEKFYREDDTFCEVIVGDFNARIGPRRTPEEHQFPYSRFFLASDASARAL
ncbi:hypothetical protein RB195_018506 [Necator americanus]|uniref:Endonuclease/exonuclease/phosphatase domain-containing protein n=1 Tax=Necator americanus TaxID=51031 RepID=A0ABR1CC95_NECAM